MARTTSFCNIYYKLDFEAAIRGHHVYQAKWTPELNQRLKCAIDTRDEAGEHDENAIGVYLWGEEGSEAGLVGHLPIEISKLTKQFINADKSNLVIATVIGKRKREVGLVIPAKYTAMTTKKEIVTVFNNELLRRKEKYKHFDWKFEIVSDFKKKAVFE